MDWIKHLVRRRDRQNDVYKICPECAYCGEPLYHDVVSSAWPESGKQCWSSRDSVGAYFYTTTEPSKWTPCDGDRSSDEPRRQ